MKQPSKKRTHKKPEIRKRFLGRGLNTYNIRRLGFGFMFMMFLFIVLAFRLAYLQIVKADVFRQKAAAMQRMDTELEPQRGTIYDANMKPLAQTVTEYELYGYTHTLYKASNLTKAQKDKVLKDLVKLTGEEVTTVKKKLTGKENLVKLASGLSRKDVETAQKKWTDNVVVKTNVSRAYPNGNFAAHLLGSVNSENRGRTGLEYEYNTILGGVKGRTVKTTDSLGNALANGNNKFFKQQDGSSLRTTIDIGIQHYVEEAIAAGMDKTGAESVTCIVMEPKTGNVLALAQTPGFDPNHANTPCGDIEKNEFKKMDADKQNEYLSKMWTNPVVSSVYEPGSTFKLITAASAIDCGASDSKSRYNCSGIINIDGVGIKCWGRAHGEQNLEEAVGNSCNPAMSRVAMDIGANRFYNYIKLFGFNDKTNIDLPGEGKSIVKKPYGMSNVDLATTGFGQGIAVTPIQMISAVNALGNDGVLMQPKIVSKIIDPSGNTTKTIKNRRIRQAVSRKTSDKMREIMEYYVEKGGGYTAYIPGYRVGGKTGTANIASMGKYSLATVTSFVAMAPMDNPQISVLVITNRPTKAEFGSNTAGPIIKEILSKVLPYKGVQKKYSSNDKKNIGGQNVKVPDVTDMRSSGAISTIEMSGLKYKVMPKSTDGEFHVVDQYPKAGSYTEKGTTVYIYSE